MGKYDKEVAMAKKLIEEWLQSSKKYQNEFVTLKKNNLAWEKKSVEQGRKLLSSGLHLTDKKAAVEIEGIVQSGLENLDMFHKEGQRIFDTHNKWALAGPRRSYATIADKFKFGKPGEERYEGIKKELGAILEQVSKGIRETESIWNTDLKFAIETQRIKLKAIAKEFEKGAASHEDALAKQIKKEMAAFSEVVEKTVVGGVMFIKDKDDWNKIKQGEFDKKEPAALRQKYEQYRNKLSVIASARVMIDKNFGRVRKSFPEDYLNGGGKEGFAAITKIRDKALFELTRFDKYYRTVMLEFEKKGWQA